MNLRRKLALPPGGPVALKTVYGVGYKLETGA
jgi:DNA-binding response OmpR family regulator